MDRMGRTGAVVRGEPVQPRRVEAAALRRREGFTGKFCSFLLTGPRSTSESGLPREQSNCPLLLIRCSFPVFSCSFLLISAHPPPGPRAPGMPGTAVRQPAYAVGGCGRKGRMSQGEERGPAAVQYVEMITFDPSDFVAWAELPNAADQLPELVRRLILATCPSPSIIDMPSGSSVHLGDWDGVLDVSLGNSWVPDGASAWEMSRQKDIPRKANSDYRKRTTSPMGQDPAQTTFIFVTPRRWKQKDAWVSRHRALGEWAEVRAWDADDLVAWIGEAPGVAHWFARLIGKLPDEGWTALDEWWEHWSRMTNPPISTGLVLAGRHSQAEGICAWAQGIPGRHYVLANTREEAIAFVASCALSADAPWGASLLSKAIVVRTVDAWQRLEHHHMPLVLIRHFKEDVASQATVQNGHHVLIPLGEHEEPHGNGSMLDTLGRDEAPNALIAMGLSETRARSLVRKSARRLSIMRRFLIDEAGGPQPEWVSNADEALVALMLVGQWDTNNEGDREIVVEVAGRTFAEIESTITALALVPDSPLQKIGSRWRFISQEEAWHLLASRLTPTILQRFERAALKVLGELSPEFDMPIGERYLASILGKVLPHSNTLREGITRGLAIMGTQPERAIHAEEAGNLPAHVIRRVLGSDSEWHKWATLGKNLAVLAEAAPEVFLDVIETNVNSSDSSFKVLFEQEGEGVFSSIPHTGILWALECLAWSEDYFGRVVKILAHLAELDPGGRVSNRPINSLCELFIPSIRMSEAPDNERLLTLAMLLRTFPNTGWQLLVMLYRETYFILQRTPPSWQPWAQDGVAGVTHRECAAYIGEMNRLLLENVRADANRWSDVLGILSRLAPDFRLEALMLLQEQVDTLKQSPNRDALWAKARAVLHHHRRYPKASWAMRQEDLKAIETIYEALMPSDLGVAHAWLFVDWFSSGLAAVPDPLPIDPQNEPVDFDADREHLAKQQQLTFAAIYAQGGIPEVLRLAVAAPNPYLVGRIASQVIDSEAALASATEILVSNDPLLRSFAHGMLQGLFDKTGWVALDRALVTFKNSTPSIEAISDVYLAAPVTLDTWQRIQNEEPDVVEAYWKQVNPFRVANLDTESICIAVQQFLDVRRSRAALHLISYASVPSSVIIRTLEQIPFDIDTPEFPELLSDGFWIGHLLESLDNEPEVSEETIARLEIPYMDILEDYRPQLALSRQVMKSPALFADLIAWVFKRFDGQDEEVVDDQTRQVRGDRAYAILRNLREVPGLLEDNAVHYETLESWVREARRLCKDRDREVIGDQQIGQVLSNAPVGSDGIWPCEPMRDLLEEIGSHHVGVGFVVGKRNQRGVTSRSLFDGGKQERTLADGYRADSARIRAQWPFTAKLLREITDNYQVEGKIHDREANWLDHS